MDLKRMASSLFPVLQRETPEDRTAQMQQNISSFWSQLYSGTFSLYGVTFTPQLAERVWTANRCIQLNAQQVSSMPLRFVGTYEPAWVSNPDPAWYPNGIGDAMFSIVWSMYGYGDAFLYITARYANGYPSAWTVLDPAAMEVKVVEGRRTYRQNQVDLDPDDVVQISRDPRGGARGTSALQTYASYLYGLAATSELARTYSGEGAYPTAVLKSSKRLTELQAQAVQDKWQERMAVRGGAPAILPPELDLQELSFSPQDLMLLDVQAFDARVIASAFGVPPHMVNMPLEGGLTYQNPAMLGEHWWRFELRPMAFRISRALSAQMLPRGSYVEHDARATLAPGFKEWADVWVSMFKEGLVTFEEFRAVVLSLPPQAVPAEALEELTTPPIASASPTDQQPAAVVELRPSQMG